MRRPPPQVWNFGRHIPATPSAELWESFALSPPRTELRNLGAPAPPQDLELRDSSGCPHPPRPGLRGHWRPSPALEFRGPRAPTQARPAGLTLPAGRPVSVRAESGAASGANSPHRAPGSLDGSGARALRAALRAARAFVCAAAAARAASGPIAVGPDAAAARPASPGPEASRSALYRPSTVMGVGEPIGMGREVGLGVRAGKGTGLGDPETETGRGEAETQEIDRRRNYNNVTRQLWQCQQP